MWRMCFSSWRLWVVAIGFLLSLVPETLSHPPGILNSVEPAPLKLGPSKPNDHPLQTRAIKREDTAIEALPPHYWQLAQSAADIEAFRQKYNLTLVSSTPQDTALMPSWPQALVQFFVILPPFKSAFDSEPTTTTTTTGGVGQGRSFSLGGITEVRYSGVHTTNTQHKRGKVGCANILHAIIAPFMFVAWVVAFAIAQVQRGVGGWVSVMGWAVWVELFTELGVSALVGMPCIFQWGASLAIIIQRWRSGFGSVAYQIDSLNGCTPIDGLAYLQQGARSHDFKILQSVVFGVSTAALFPLIVSTSDNSCLQRTVIVSIAVFFLAVAELIFTAVVAGRGTPMVVSGNCLLVELSPRLGFLDSNISTRWKVLATFMGF